MGHVLATASLHDGGGIFSLAWAFGAIPFSLALIFNYRGMAERQRSGGHPVHPLMARLFGGVFLVFGIFALFEAINRLAQGGY